MTKAPNGQRPAPIAQCDMPSMRTRDITALIRHRHRGPLPDDDDGRDTLRLALSHIVRKARGGEVARDFAAQWAPWCGAAERDKMIDELFASPELFTAAELGRRLNLTADEKLLLGIRTIRAANVTEEQWRRILADRHVERQRAYRRRTSIQRDVGKQRGRRRAGDILRREDLSPRARDLFARLKPKAWVHLPDVARAWTDGEVGAQTLKTRRTTVARLVKELQAALLVEIKEERTRNGRPVLVVQRIADELLTVAHARSVAMPLRQGSDAGVEVATGETRNADNSVSSSTSDCDSSSVRHTGTDCDNGACAMYRRYYVTHATRMWTFRTYDVRLSIGGTSNSAGGAPEAPPGPSTGNVSDTTGDQTVMAEPNPISITDLLSPRAPTGARAGTPQPIQLDPTTGEFWPDIEPGPRVEHAADFPVIWPLWTDRARAPAA